MPSTIMISCHRCMHCIALLLVASWALLGAGPGGEARAQGIRIYIDADGTGARTSAEAIEQGVRTALSEVGDRLAGRPVEVVFKNHRGNSRRSKRHLDDYLSDDSALAVFAGMHSPPLLAHRDFINENAILMLVPWAAAGPITRYSAPENWIFRLSVDDTQAGHFIAEHAVQVEGFQRPFLLLEDTGWGRSNHLTMSKALAGLATTQGVRAAGVQWFNWNIGENQARALLRLVARSEADVIFLVANAPEAVVFAHAMLGMEASAQRPIRSHWGISGGNFADIIDHQMRSRLDLAFIQTRYPFLDGQLNTFQADVLARAARLYPRTLGTPSTMKAPAGFFHGYDLTRLLISAAEQAGLDGDMLAVRRRVRSALENLEQPVKGLMKLYRRPFLPGGHPDAHEALTSDDYVMATFGPEGGVRLFFRAPPGS